MGQVAFLAFCTLMLEPGEDAWADWALLVAPAGQSRIFSSEAEAKKNSEDSWDRGLELADRPRGLAHVQG
jgi:hypothetical protein